MFRYIVCSTLIAGLVSITSGCQSVSGSDDLQSDEVGGEYGINNCCNM